MHGRLKVRTTAEVAARKQKEREQKAKVFRAGMQRILSKKDLNELDDELMELTGRILGVQPDIALLWNLRRQFLQLIGKSDGESEKQLFFDKDLGLTEMCLQINPKSYCAWHHRCWVLENCPSPNWQKEVDLCLKYLKLDERNFHCWSYRRYVVAKAEIPPEKELEFCTEKIQNNFSNYSSWHYRSKLLPILFPHPSDPSRPISEEKLTDELELVLTAAFTDPGDSSAWFYQRWLLGNSRPELDFAAFRLDAVKGLAVVSFTRPVNLKHQNCLLSSNFCDQISQKEDWEPASPGSSNDVTWIIKNITGQVREQETLTLTFTDEEAKEHKLEIRSSIQETLFAVRKPKFGTEFGDAVVDILKAQLESCQQLLEYEPDSKWTLLTAALLSKAIDCESNHAKTIQYLEKLKIVDSMRAGYYQDLIGKWGMEVRLAEWIDKGRPDERLDLSGLGLGHVTYEQYLAVAGYIDLDETVLRSVNKFDHLVFCRKLTVAKKGAVSSITEAELKKYCPNLHEIILK